MLLYAPLAQNCCFTPFTLHVALLLLLDLLSYSFYSTYYSAPLIQLVAMLLLLDLLLGSFYLTYCSILLIQPVVSLLLLNLLFMYFSAMLVILLFLVPFVQCYCSCFSYFRLVFPHPLLFCWFEFFSILLLVQIRVL